VPYISETDSPPLDSDSPVQDLLQMRDNTTESLGSSVDTSLESLPSPRDISATEGQPVEQSSPPTAEESDSINIKDSSVTPLCALKETAYKHILKPKRVTFNSQVYYSDDPSEMTSNGDTSSHNTTDGGGKSLSSLNVTPSSTPTRRIILVLFSGTDSVGEVLRKRYPDCDVVNVDSDGKSPNLTHHVDVLQWKYWQHFQPGEVYAVWASPPCTAFSRTNTLNTTPAQQLAHARKLELGCKIAKKTIEIINYLNPEEFFIENPQGGLREQKFMQDFKSYRATTSYCMFGKPFRKNTDI